jgi:protoporphyrin/coproporphyrin ferrochelatase
MPADQRSKLAVVLFNLGGPDRPEAIRPFLLNLFRDPAILRVPGPVRAVLARVITRGRLRPARENYALLDGRSPLLELTRAQAEALEAALPEFDVHCFIAMRYWHPFSDVAAQAVRAWGAKQVMLLPLYPQFSTTTTDSSLTAWHAAAAKAGLAAETRAVCCYATESLYLEAVADLLGQFWAQALVALPQGISLRMLFSAHGLPESIVAHGDPYQRQVEQSVAGVLAAWGEGEIDWAICYQSRATPQRWLEPSTISEIERAARDRVALLVVPIAFVSEHSETLVELDIEYRHLAERLGVPGYFRVPAPGVHRAFIAALAQVVRDGLARPPGVHSYTGSRICPESCTDCPCRHMAGQWMSSSLAVS